MMVMKRIEMMMNSPIEFVCAEEDWNVIPKPYRASKFTPEWFKRLPQKVDGRNILNNSTIKRCMPFLDAMSIGWIIPLAADVQIRSSGEGGFSGINYEWKFHKPMIENHSMQQLGTKDHPNPINPKPPMKFLNYWAIKAKPGWSVLFVPPLNRPNELFECIAGMVDCDRYFEFVNFPFVFNKPNFEGIIPAGTPLVQAIPIKRSMLQPETLVRKMNKKDLDRLRHTRLKRSSHESYYKDQLWSKK